MKWNQIYKERGAVQTKPLEVVKTFEKMLPKNNNINILDLGCGTGRHTLYLSKHSNFQIYSLDIAPEGLKIINEKAKRSNLSNIATFTGDFSSLPFENDYFDAVLSTKALHHGAYNDIEKYVSEISRVLKSSGLLLLVILSDKDFRAQTGKKYHGDKNTRIGCDNLPDSNLPHHFFNDSELEKVFENYIFVKRKITERIAMAGLKPSTYYDLILKKK